MTKYICDRCLKEFSQKSHYEKHKNNKKPCQDNTKKIEEVVENIINQKWNEVHKKLILNEVYEKDQHQEQNMTEQNKFIDLFAGTGAFSYVFEKNNFECVFANDMMDSSKKIYELNNDHKGVFRLEDLNNITIEDVPKHNLLCGGFPCQPFSIAGNQKGFEDSRSNVFWKILEILKHHKPNIILLENVKNLTSHDNGNTYKTILEHLTNIGYHIKSKVLDTCQITKVPQHRERIYIVGFLDQQKHDSFDFDFPVIENLKILDFLDKKVDNKYYYTDKLKVYEEVNKEVKKHINENTLYQYRRYYIRENKSNCCPTLTANMGGGGHNVPILKDDQGIRKLTPRECFNLQGFPREYKLPELCDSALYKLAGNAVSIPVIELIINKLKELEQLG